MPRAHGCAGAAMFKDERYAAGAWMLRSGDVQDERYAAGVWIPKAFTALTGQALRRSGDIQDERVVNCSSAIAPALP